MAEIRRLGKSFAGFHGFNKIQDTKSGITTYTAKVVSTPGGNRYSLNDRIVDSPYFFSGYTYEINLDDVSNTGHPLLFSTTLNGTLAQNGSVYTDGVTYHINGATVDQNSYINNFDTATTRRIQITVADKNEANQSAPGILYYYCWNHTNMAGESYINIQASDNDVLVYTNADLQDRNEEITLTNGNVLDDPPNTDDRDDPANAYPYRNLRDQETGMTYEQWQVVQESILYYLDDKGFLRVKYNENHTYGDPV
jgi:hypothetical protein